VRSWAAGKERRGTDAPGLTGASEENTSRVKKDSVFLSALERLEEEADEDEEEEEEEEESVELPGVDGSDGGDRGMEGALDDDSAPERSYESRRTPARNKPFEKLIPDELLPRMCIVGRPNVGKSALFNRIVGKKVAIVYDYPGVTRDRLYTRANWGGRDFMLVDTGGLMSKAEELQDSRERDAAIRSISEKNLPSAIERQAAAAVEESDSVILVVDGQTGPTASDEEVLTWLRQSHPGKSVTLAVNKCENVGKADEQASVFWEFGIEPIAVSAISGSGTGELLDMAIKGLPAPLGYGDMQDAKVPISMAIVGRPNVGKSSLLNSLVGKERSIVSSMAGTTRDAIDTDIDMPDGRRFKLIDTAGVRKRASIASGKDGAEPLSVERAFHAVRRAEVAVLVIDASEGVTQQDFRLSEYVAAEGRACVVVVNKWDKIPAKTDHTLSDFEANVRAELRPVEWANIVFTSALTGQRVKRVLDAATAAAEEHRRRITTATLNMVIQDATGWRAPPSTGQGRRGRVYYGTQAGVKPPTFVMFCNDPKLFPEDYRKYMERQFRENIGYPGSPLRIFYRGKTQNTDLE
jgi:GTP-binding protein